MRFINTINPGEYYALISCAFQETMCPIIHLLSLHIFSSLFHVLLQLHSFTNVTNFYFYHTGTIFNVLSNFCIMSVTLLCLYITISSLFFLQPISSTTFSFIFLLHFLLIFSYLLLILIFKHMSSNKCVFCLQKI